MMWNTAHNVLLVSEDSRFLNLMALELRSMGYRVVCARDLEQAAALVRAGVTTRFVLVRLGDDVVPPAVLRDEMAARLPGWVVEPDEPVDRHVN